MVRWWLAMRPQWQQQQRHPEQRAVRAHVYLNRTDWLVVAESVHRVFRGAAVRGGGAASDAMVAVVVMVVVVVSDSIACVAAAAASGAAPGGGVPP